jgi:hypothetical protein
MHIPTHSIVLFTHSDLLGIHFGVTLAKITTEIRDEQVVQYKVASDLKSFVGRDVYKKFLVDEANLHRIHELDFTSYFLPEYSKILESSNSYKRALALKAKLEKEQTDASEESPEQTQ